MTYSSAALCYGSRTKWEERKLLGNGTHVNASAFNSHRLTGKKTRRCSITAFPALFKKKTKTWEVNRLIIGLLLHRKGNRVQISNELIDLICL